MVLNVFYDLSNVTWATLCSSHIHTWHLCARACDFLSILADFSTSQSEETWEEMKEE